MQCCLSLLAVKGTRATINSCGFLKIRLREMCGFFYNGQLSNMLPCLAHNKAVAGTGDNSAFTL